MNFTYLDELYAYVNPALIHTHNMVNRLVILCEINRVRLQQDGGLVCSNTLSAELAPTAAGELHYRI